MSEKFQNPFEPKNFLGPWIIWTQIILDTNFSLKISLTQYFLDTKFFLELGNFWIEISFNQKCLGKVRTGLVRTYQVRTGLVRVGQVRAGQNFSDPIIFCGPQIFDTNYF